MPAEQQPHSRRENKACKEPIAYELRNAYREEVDDRGVPAYEPAFTSQRGYIIHGLCVQLIGVVKVPAAYLGNVVLAYAKFLISLLVHTVMGRTVIHHQCARFVVFNIVRPLRGSVCSGVYDPDRAEQQQEQDERSDRLEGAMKPAFCFSAAFDRLRQRVYYYPAYDSARREKFIVPVHPAEQCQYDTGSH